MEHFILGIMTFLVIVTWIYVFYRIWTKTRQKPRPNQILGYVESMVETPEGLSVSFRINEEAKNSEGIRIIKDATLHSVSLVKEPGPSGGHITHVDGKPDIPKPRR